MSAEDRASAYPRLVPTVVFEPISPTDASGDVDEKVQRYHDNGVPLVVVIDPEVEATELSRPSTNRVRLDTPMVEIGPEMTGFVLDTAAVIAVGRES
jgi:Uma2 family endonuclease